MKYEVGVIRIGYGHTSFIVEADSEEQAGERALEEAGDHEFTENSSDYELDYTVVTDDSEEN